MKMNKPIRRRQIRRKKKGICQFLYEKLEDETFGLARWTDKDRGEFCLHWLHASSGSWTVETDSELFRLWALHKGRLADKKKYKTLKANFRCAMKSRYELEEMKEPPNSGRKDLKFWKFTDLSFVKQQQTAADPCQKENREANDHRRRSEAAKTAKNSTKAYKCRRRTKPAIDYDGSDEAENGQEKSYADSDLLPDFNLLSGRDNFVLPLGEQPETTYFMDILGQDRSVQDELMQFRPPSYSDLRPLSVEEADVDSNSDLDTFVTSQIISGRMDTFDGAVAYECKGQIGQFYSDSLPERPGLSVP